MKIIHFINKNKLVVNIFSFGSATMISAILAFVLGIITRNLLEPEQYGYWLSVSMIFPFIPIFQMGTLSAMNKQVPFYLARGEKSKAEEIQRLTFSFLFTLPLIFILVLLFFCIYLFYQNIEYEYKIGFLLTSIISLFLFVSGYLEMYYKSQQNFRLASKLLITKFGSQFIATIFLIYVMGYEGMFYGYLISLIIEIIVGRKAFEKMKFILDKKQFYSLIRIGFPILLVGLVWNLMIASDRLIISLLMSPVDVGNYGVGMLIFSTMMLFPQVVGQVLYPKIIELVSQKEYKNIIKFYWTVNKILGVIMVIVITLGYISMPLFINFFMPNYVNGIETARILLIGIFPLTLVGFAANYFNSTQNQSIYLKIQVISIIINVIGSLILLKIQYSINSVAYATSISFFIYFILMNLYFFNKVKEEELENSIFEKR